MSSSREIGHLSESQSLLSTPKMASRKPSLRHPQIPEHLHAVKILYMGRILMYILEYKVFQSYRVFKEQIKAKFVFRMT